MHAYIDIAYQKTLKPLDVVHITHLAFKGYLKDLLKNTFEQITVHSITVYCSATMHIWIWQCVSKLQIKPFCLGVNPSKAALGITVQK